MIIEIPPGLYSEMHGAFFTFSHLIPGRIYSRPPGPYYGRRQTACTGVVERGEHDHELLQSKKDRPRRVHVSPVVQNVSSGYNCVHNKPARAGKHLTLPPIQQSKREEIILQQYNQLQPYTILPEAKQARVVSNKQSPAATPSEV
jgi:hypothetical protein